MALRIKKPRVKHPLAPARQAGQPVAVESEHRLSASNRTPREINRNLILNLIRHNENISRADLARLCGLPRSTISIIVEQLMQDRWVVEGSVGQLPRGRRPTYLQLNSSRCVLAIDIHPTQTTLGIADLDGRIAVQKVVEMPGDPKKGMKTLLVAVKRMIAANPERSFSGIGVCIPGRANLRLDKLIFAPNLRFPILGIKNQLQKATGLPVSIDNVANACAIAEVWSSGPGKKRNLVVLNVSEGIGTGIFMSGQLLRGEDGTAGEFGHVQLEPNGLLCACGARGCWETLASNRAGLRYYQEFSGCTVVPSFEGLIRLSKDGDDNAKKALTKMSVELGRGMRMVATALAPKEIIVVGDITTMWHELGSVVMSELSRHTLHSLPIVRPATDRGLARLRGAVAIVLYEHSV
ncbi:MAG: ROK family transcriptional regulator [Bryocella sp.]